MLKILWRDRGYLSVILLVGLYCIAGLSGCSIIRCGGSHVCR